MTNRSLEGALTLSLSLFLFLSLQVYCSNLKLRAGASPLYTPALVNVLQASDQLHRGDSDAQAGEQGRKRHADRGV